MQELPDFNYETLRFLCLHLSNVTSKATINKMDVRNLAIVFGPTLIRAADDNMTKMVTDMSHQCRIVEMLISQVNKLLEAFKKPSDQRSLVTNILEYGIPRNIIRYYYTLGSHYGLLTYCFNVKIIIIKSQCLLFASQGMISSR